MEVEKLQKLIGHYRKLDARVKGVEAKCKADTEDDKALMKRIQEKLKKHIHREEGGLRNVNTSDGALAYARYEDKYRVTEIEELKKWVLGTDDMVETGEGVLLSPTQLAEIMDRMDIFSNTLKKDPIIIHRRDTGAIEEDDMLKGGELPGGVGLYTHKEVRIRKS